MKCRTCGSSQLTRFLDLGFTPPADQFLHTEQLREPETHYPLEVMMCGKCGLAQLGYVVPPEILYQRDYPYEASITRTGRLHWEELARTVKERLSFGSDALVVDIGSNVGVLLNAFKTLGARVVGVEPAGNIATIAEKNGIETINDFFSMDVARQIVASKGHASLITATNVFAHVDDLTGFMKAIDELLHPQGVFIIEAPYFVNLIEKLEYDTIYHEHLSYLSVRPLSTFFEGFGMEIHHIEQRDIHGGSFRVHVSRAGSFPISSTVNEMLDIENEKGIHGVDVLKKFAQDVERNRRDLLKLLLDLKLQGKSIAAVSAPAKGMTLLNYCGVGTHVLDFITEKSNLKIGRFTPGTHIPVMGDEALIARMPEYALLLAWNFAEEIMDNLKDYRKKGGKFILPIPEPRIVD